MAISTNLVAGLSSGFDWRSMIDQLMEIEHRRVDLVTARKTDTQTKLTEWRSVNTMLLALKTSSQAISNQSAFNVFKVGTTSNTSTSAANLLSVSASSSASPAVYNIKVNNVAQSEKISSKDYSDTSTSLGLTGDILISGKLVSIASTNSLSDIKDKINAANTGATPSNVTASIVSHASDNYHLILTSDETGAEGLSALEGAYSGGNNILQSMGFISAATTIKTTTSDGAKSDLFTSSNGAIKTLLGLSSAPGATNVTIGGNLVSIDLSSDGESLTTIAQKIDALAGVSAVVVSEEVDGETKYRIDISGTTSFTDSGNILQTLGILKGTYGSIQEVHSGSAMYAMGGAAVTAATTFANIFTGILRGDQQNTKVAGGYISASTQWNEINTTGVPGNDIEGGETIRVEGTKHDGTAVDATYTIADPAETLGATGGFLEWLETQFGGSAQVDAYIDSNGRLLLEDRQSGSSQLGISNMTYTGTNLTFSSTEPFGNNLTNGDTISISGTRGDGTTVSTITYTISDVAANTINNLISKIHTGEGEDDAFGETTRTATASVSSGKIIITDGTAGDSQLSLSLVANNQGGGTLNFGTISIATEGRSMQVAAGADAEIVVDNVTITNASNTITDVIAGTTLNLVGADSDTTITVKVERDLGAIKDKIKSLADNFNSIMDYISTQFTYDEENEKTGGLLFGDGTLSSVKSDLINMITETVTGASIDFNRLAQIGISLDLGDSEEGKYNNISLSIDDAKLTLALETDFDKVRKLFIAYGASADSNFEYISHTSDTQGGAYAVNITQAATRTTVTGSKALGGTLLEAVEVTVADFAAGREAVVSLGASSNIDDVVNALNSQFAQVYTEVLTGSDATGKSSSTLFSAVTGADNGDVITFSGKRSNGLNVSGSYTIVDKTTETVGDLLNSIEDMFEDEVTVALDGTGKIVITSTQAGDSQLYFTIDTQSAGITGLDFGTVSTTTEGRFAMDVTASKSGSNELVLTHNTYGTGHILVVSETSASDPLGLDNATQVYGSNVAGTINSITATGSGQTLSVDSDGNNADGLSITYTGTTSTSTTFTMTLGIAELLSRQMNFITNSTDGYVTYKQTSLQDSIDSFGTQIEQMEDRLNRKMEMMINRFVAMEVALSKMQSQSNWMAGQIDGLYGGWR